MPADILVYSACHHSGVMGIEPCTRLGAAPSVLAALRAPTFLPAALFESHWTWWLAGVLLGSVLLFVGTRRADRVLLRIGQALLAITALWILAAFAFDTAGERLYRAHATLTAATERQDVDTIVSYLGNGFVADGGELGEIALTRDNARQGMAEVLHEYTPREIHITAYRVEPLPNGGAMTHLIVIANVNNIGPTKTYWGITWTDEPGADWRITRLAAETPPSGSGKSLTR